MWAGTLWLPRGDDPLPKIGGMGFLHTPSGVHLVAIENVVSDDDGVRVDVAGFLSSDPGLCMGSLEYETAG